MLEKLIDRRSDYEDVHVIKALLLLAKRPSGREKLMKELRMSEASARTMLNNMRRFNLARSTTKGHELTEKGKRLAGKFQKQIEGPKNLGKTSITVSDFNTAYLVRRMAGKIKKGLEQRDVAVRVGADGLTTLVCRNNKLFLAGVESRVPKGIEKLFKTKSGDVILIGSAMNKHKADMAALKTALSLFD